MRFSTRNLREVYGETLVELGEVHKNLVVLDADLCTSTLTSLFRDAFPKRFIQCGIAEANMFSIAAGLAYMGYITFPSTFAAFTTRKALDTVFMNICYQKLNVKIPGSYPGLTATECGPSHNMCEDIIQMRSLPGIYIAAPGDDRELKSLMQKACETKGPIYFRVPKINAPVLFEEGFSFEWGKGSRLMEGDDITLISTGMMTAVSLEAGRLLEKDGIHADVLHLSSIRPMDEQLIISSVKKTGAVISIENGRIYGGFGSAIAELLVRKCPTPMDMMGIGDFVPESGPLGTLMQRYGLTPVEMSKRAKNLLKLWN